jgi:hypothetical protein
MPPPPLPHHPLDPPYRAPLRPNQPPPTTFYTLSAAGDGRRRFRSASAKWHTQTNPTRIRRFQPRKWMSLEVVPGRAEAVIEVRKSSWERGRQKRAQLMRQYRHDKKVWLYLLEFLSVKHLLHPSFPPSRLLRGSNVCCKVPSLVSGPQDCRLWRAV